MSDNKGINNSIMNFPTKRKYSSGRRKFFKYGLPFLLLMVGGSFGLREFTNIKFQYYSAKKITQEQFEKEGIQMKKSDEVTLDTEYEKIKLLNIDDWEQVRGPRPWESN